MGKKKISNDEILSTLEYAKANKSNIKLIDSILEKAGKMRGLTHREAAVLLECDIPEKNEAIYKLANDIKMAYYGNRIVTFAPLYLSNYCVNGCVYCPYHFKNKHIINISKNTRNFTFSIFTLFSSFYCIIQKI